MSLPALLPERAGIRSSVPRPRLLVAARWPVGGIRVHLQVNAPYLTEAGFTCTYVAPAGEALDTLRAGLEHLPGTEFVGVESTAKGCNLWPTLRRLIRSGRYALVHAHGMTAACHATAAVLGRSVPLLVTLHEPLRANQFLGLRGRVKRWLLGRWLRRSAGLVTVSEDARANLIESLPGLASVSNRLAVLPNGIDAARYEGAEYDSSGDLRRRLRVAAGVSVIGYLGRFMPEKGFPVLLDALSRLSACPGTRPWHLAAFGSSDYRREYQRRIDGCGLASHVTLCDFVSDVRPLMPQFDLVVVPSLWEASSLVSMEAMASGVPVLGSDCPGLREVLRGTPSHTVPVGDADALAEGLLEALRLPWTHVARNYAPKARLRFDNERSARGLVNLISGLLTRKPLAPEHRDEV
jgi:glycosyltransferase involved in cell wall biosynthesis